MDKNERIAKALECLGMEHTPELEAQFLVLWEALEIFEERSEDYGEVWKQYGALNNLVRSAVKVDRLMEQWWFGSVEAGDPVTLRSDGLDDGYDAINYLVFFIRQARWGNITGQKKTRPALTIVGEDD